MATSTSQEQHLVALTRIRRIPGKPGDPYEIIFVNYAGLPIISLTEWYRLRKEIGPDSTRNTYLACLMPYFSYLEEQACPWNASPERLRPVLVAFYRDRLGCKIHPRKDGAGVEVIPTRDTPLRPSTLQVLRAALRDFYLVLKDAGLYAFANPLSSEVLVALKREKIRALANSGAPEHAGIREETHEQSRRRPTAFLRHPKDHAWEPELRRELVDVREGMHTVLNAMLDGTEVFPREKAVLELLQNTGARLHEIVLMTVGGYRNEGIAGQARVVNKGSYGREIKTIYFAHNPKVQRALAVYLEQVRPLHDLQRRQRLTDVGDQEPLFLTERGTPYSTRAFYWHWYRHYRPLQEKCPVGFSPHDIRHLFISEYLIKLKRECGAGTEQFQESDYLQAREAFGSLVMGWSSNRTINVYDHTRTGEKTLFVLAGYQKDLSQRRYVPEPILVPEPRPVQLCMHVPTREEINTPATGETIWLHDEETLAWVKKRQQQARPEVREGR